MAISVEWEIEGTEFANCNCAYGCGCQFNALPDKGFCEAVAGHRTHVVLQRCTLQRAMPLPRKVLSELQRDMARRGPVYGCVDHAGSSCRQMPSKNRERFRPGSPSA
jgi:hypothetical protein